MANNEYKMEWKSVNNDLSADDYDSQPLSTAEMTSIRGYAELIAKSLADGPGGTGGYDAASVKRLSDDLNRTRAKLDEDGRVKIANLYGAFLGHALIAANPHAEGKWVRTKGGDVAIRFGKAKNDMTIFALPITRVFKQIDEGEVYSIYSYFLAMPESLSSRPAAEHAPAGSSTKTSAGAAPAKANDSIPQELVQIGHAADGSDLVIAIPQGLCCNCGVRNDVRPVESPMHHRRALDGREIHFSLNLPYCRTCSGTAGRQPKSLAYKAIATLIAYSVFMFMILMPLTNYPFFAKHGGLVLGLFTLCVIGTFYWIRKPAAPQTSVYQPVNLSKFSGSYDSINHVGFKFSNTAYAKDFSKLNRRILTKGILKVT